MANAHFKTALTHAGLTVEEFADIIRVDPKTVQRWVAGRTPYARHRGTISRALDIPEHELWPDSVDAPAPIVDSDATPSLSDVAGIRAWAYAHDDDAPDAVALLTDVSQDLDLLDGGGDLLLLPGVVRALQNQVNAGCRVRVIVGSLTPGQEWTTDLQRLGPRSLENMQAHHVVLRVDDTILLAIPLRDGQSAPLFALNRPQAVDIFDRFVADMNRHWDTATPITQADAPAPSDTPSIASETGDPPRRWPRQPN